MKKQIGNYMKNCATCQQMKVEHWRSIGALQSLGIPECKWGHVTMDFVVGLPRMHAYYDAIWVVGDRLRKTAHFLSIKNTTSFEKLAKLYIKEIVKLHEVPISTVPTEIGVSC